VADGGVTTRDIPVREETMKSGRPSSESAWVDQYKKRGSQLAVRAQWETNQGKYDVVGASLSEPHTSMTSLRACVCMLVCLYACLRGPTTYQKF